MADPSNPYLPDKLSTLGMMLTGLGSGIGAAASRNLPFYFGVAPGAEAFQNSYNNVVNRGRNYDLARKNYDLNASYKNMQERMIDLQSQALQNKLETTKQLLKLIPGLSGGGASPPGGGASQPGFNVQPPALGPDSTPTAIPPGVQMRMPQINQAASQYGVRPELAAGVFSQESEGDPNAESPAGAQGFAQLMPGTARDLGVSNPKDPLQAIPAGAKYLSQMIQKYNGNETLGLMAYNWGPGNVDNWLKSGADPAKIPAETRNYVQKVNGYASAGQPQQTSPRVAPQPNGMPPMPGPPPNTTGVQVLAGLSGMPEVGTALAAYPQSLYKYNVDQYNRQFEAQKYRQSSAQSPVAVGPNGETSTNTALVNAAAEKAAAEEKAKAQAHSEYVFPPGIDSSDKTPEQKLAMLPPNIRGVVKDLGPEGSLALSDLPTRMAASGIDPSKVDIMSLAKGIYGDQFDMRTKELAKNFMTDVYAGDKPEGATRYALITATQHLNTFASLVKAQANGDYPAINAIVKQWNEQKGNPRFSGGDALMQFLAPEAAKVVKGGNALNKDEVDRNVEQLMNTKSWPQASAILQTWVGAMLARKNGLEETARSLGIPESKIAKLWGQGSVGPDGKPQPSSMQKSLDQFYETTGGELVHGPGGQPQQAQGPKPGTVLGRTKDGREVYVGPDGKQYVR